jgi:DNA mismatch repair protein MutL
VPARLAAAARPQTEVAQIGAVARRLALAAPDVRLTLVVDERTVLRTSGSGDLLTALVEIYGPALAESLLPLGPVAVAGVRLWGAISGPELTRPGRGQIHVITNGRWAQPRTLLSMVEAAYRPLLPRGRHPVLALVLAVPPDRVDINIHPAKAEVRLLDERAIGEAAAGLIREALARRPIPLRLEPDPALADLGAPATMLAERPADWDDEGPIVTPGLPPLRLVGQVHDRLVLLEGPAGLYLVDQHRAHERILYERLRTSYGGAGPEPAALAEPLMLELRPAQAARFGRRLDTLARLGFTCEVFGGRTFLVRAAPDLPGVMGAPAGAALAGLGSLEDLTAGLIALADEEAAEGEDWQERLLVNLSCRTAVRRGRPLPRATMRALVEALGQTSAPAVCPHGSPLLMHVSGNLLERQFGWR